MIYFSTYETFFAIFAFLIFGIICGTIKPSAYQLLHCFCFCPFSVVRAYKKYIKLNKARIKTKQKGKSLFLKREIFDFLSTLFIALIYIFMLYIFLDGSFRLFVLLSFIFGYFISKKRSEDFVRGL